ncbi:MAG: hypothetical protein JO337_08970 [Acidimicrobiales bacterium]|nr:hypothetical protein [Acidimicrobiales bacterium]
MTEPAWRPIIMPNEASGELMSICGDGLGGQPRGAVLAVGSFEDRGAEDRGAEVRGAEVRGAEVRRCDPAVSRPMTRPAPTRAIVTTAAATTTLQVTRLGIGFSCAGTGSSSEEGCVMGSTMRDAA